jgi:hypothetical protein
MLTYDIKTFWSTFDTLAEHAIDDYHHTQEQHHVLTTLRQAHLFNTSYECKKQRKTGTFPRKSPGTTTTPTTSHSREAFDHAQHFPAAGGFSGADPVRNSSPLGSRDRRPLVCLARNFFSLVRLFSLPVFLASFFLVSPIVVNKRIFRRTGGFELAAPSA